MEVPDFRGSAGIPQENGTGDVSARCEDATKPGFEAANYPQALGGSVYGILGTVNRNTVYAGLPYLFVVDKSAGKELMRDLLLYDNSQFTMGAMENLIYVIHGKSVRCSEFIPITTFYGGFSIGAAAVYFGT